MTCLVQARFPLTPPNQRDYNALKFWDFNIPIGTRLGWDYVTPKFSGVDDLIYNATSQFYSEVLHVEF